jgi:hypothetical protein
MLAKNRLDKLLDTSPLVYLVSELNILFNVSVKPLDKPPAVMGKVFVRYLSALFYD